MGRLHGASNSQHRRLVGSKWNHVVDPQLSDAFDFLQTLFVEPCRLVRCVVCWVVWMSGDGDGTVYSGRMG